MKLEIPKHTKHYNFIRLSIENIGVNYKDLLESVRVSELHSKFLNNYNLDKAIVWIF